MPRYDFRHGTLARRNAEAKVARHNAMKVATALPAPVRAQRVADVLQVLSDVDLAAALSGGVNLEAVFRKELANRGLDVNGQWIGFDAAEVAFDDWYSSNRRSEDGAHQGTGL